MKECKECELAVYCYSEPSTWVFRTKQEMEEKQSAISDCQKYAETQKERCGNTHQASQAGAS